MKYDLVMYTQRLKLPWGVWERSRPVRFDNDRKLCPYNVPVWHKFLR